MDQITFFSSYSSEALSTFRSLVEQHHRFAICTHMGSDYDSVGSSSGLYLFLKTLNKEVYNIFPTAPSQNFRWIKGMEDCLVYEESQKKLIEETLTNTEVLFCLDFNDLKRLDKLSDFVESLHIKKVLIDHHQNPTDEFTNNLAKIGASSTSELIYDLIRSMAKVPFHPEILKALYAGIISDTGGFQYNTTQASTHRIAAEIISYLPDHTKVYEKISSDFTLAQFQFFQNIFLHHSRLVREDTIIQWISIDDYGKYGVTQDDTEGLVNYPMRIQSIVNSVLIKQTEPNFFKLSFRSKEENILEIAKKFEGGGHKMAAGGRYIGNLSDLIEKIVAAFEL